MEEKDYLRKLVEKQKDSDLLIELEQLRPGLKANGGSLALRAPDLWLPFQTQVDDLYLGFTTPQAAQRESAHWHPAGTTEAYILLWGRAIVWTKHYWETKWLWREVPAGSIFVAQAGVCHLWQWTQDDAEQALAVVAKAKPQAGIGRDKGKITCEFCPVYGRTCDGPPSDPLVHETVNPTTTLLRTVIVAPRFIDT